VHGKTRTRISRCFVKQKPNTRKSLPPNRQLLQHQRKGNNRAPIPTRCTTTACREEKECCHDRDREPSTHLRERQSRSAQRFGEPCFACGPLGVSSTGSRASHRQENPAYNALDRRCASTFEPLIINRGSRSRHVPTMDLKSCARTGFYMQLGVLSTEIAVRG